MVVGEVLQSVPVLVVDFILQPGNESSRGKESAPFVPSPAEPTRSPRPIPVQPLRGRTTRDGARRARGKSSSIPFFPPSPGRRSSFPSAGSWEPGASRAERTHARAAPAHPPAHPPAHTHTPGRVPGAGREPEASPTGTGRSEAAPRGLRPAPPRSARGLGWGLRPLLLFVEWWLCPLRSLRFGVPPPLQPPHPPKPSPPLSLQYDVGHRTIQAAIFVCQL